MTARAHGRTRSFARVLGPFLTIVIAVALIRSADMPQLLSEFTDSAVWPWVSGAFVLLGGIAIVAFHQVWRGAAAVVISVLGWLLVVRGIVLLAFPEFFDSLARRVMDVAGVWIPVLVVMGLVGLYLTYEGWKPVSEHESDVDVHISIDHHHAA